MKTIQHTAISYATTKARIGKSIVTPRQFFLVALALILEAAFFGCDLFGAKGVTIKERIDMFMKDVNEGNYSNLWKHIHPSADYFEQAKSADYWNKPGVFPSGEKYSLEAIVPVLDVVTTKLNSTASYKNAIIIFTMQKDGDDYKILKITIDSAQIIRNLVSR